MQVLVVMAHPRPDSLTGQIAKAVIEGLQAAGHETELADLYAEGFDPLILPADEPDQTTDNKIYSEAVQSEIKRLERNQRGHPGFSDLVVVISRNAERLDRPGLEQRCCLRLENSQTQTGTRYRTFCIRWAYVRQTRLRYCN